VHQRELRTTELSFSSTALVITNLIFKTPEYLEQKGGQQIMKYDRTGAFDEDFQKYNAKVFEGGYSRSILYWFLVYETSDRFEACHEAFLLMARSSLKKVGILWGSEGPPESLEGCWQIENWLKEGKVGRLRLSQSTLREETIIFNSTIRKSCGLLLEISA
jgi:hypothetical protein